MKSKTQYRVTEPVVLSFVTMRSAADGLYDGNLFIAGRPCARDDVRKVAEFARDQMSGISGVATPTVKFRDDPNGAYIDLPIQPKSGYKGSRAALVRAVAEFFGSSEIAQHYRSMGVTVTTDR